MIRREPLGGEPAPPARSCPACSARAAGRSEQSRVEGNFEDVVVGAGTAATASDQISDCFLPEGAGSREGKKGRGSRVWFLPPPRFLFASVRGTGEPSAVLSKISCGVWFFFF